MKPEQIILFAVILAIGYLFYIVMAPFLTPILWATVLTILFYPVYNWLKKRWRLNEMLSSLITCTVVVVFLTLPVAILSLSLVEEVFNLYKWLEAYIRESTMQFHGSPVFMVKYIQNILSRYIEISDVDIKDILLKGAKEASNYIVNGVTGIISNFTVLSIDIVMTLFAMFYLFKDGDRLVEYLKGLLPFSGKDKDAIFKKSKDVMYATLYGGVLVAVMQGGLGGLTFWIVGLSSPVFWGTVMAMFAFLPVIGTPAIWLPAAIYLFIQMNYVSAIVMVLVGVIIVVMGDVLRPVIVSGKTDIHPLLLLFSIFGGIETIGFIGIIAGPIILSLALTMVDMYKVAYLKRSGTDEKV